MTNYKIQGFPTKRYGVTEKKKAELDLLTEEVIDAQHDVQQFQAMVTSLSEKSAKFDGLLDAAKAKRDQSLTNWNLVKDIKTDIKDLIKGSEIALTEMSQTDVKVDNLTVDLTQMIKELIYSAEMIDKLSNLVIRKKTQNPLISEELISVLSEAGKDANNAVSLTLIALKSTYTAQSSNKETESSATLEFMQAVKLYETLTGEDLEGKALTNSKKCLYSRLDSAYKDSKEEYKEARAANDLTTIQLDEAKLGLEKAETKLKSVQSGLAAANAAALAS
ncbi:MAG: hypothetical protein ABJG68_07485 [Crocinitomicaceae bacterium]